MTSARKGRPVRRPQLVAPAHRTSDLLHWSGNLRQSGIYVAFVVIVALFAILTDGLLLSPENITNIVLQYSYILVLAIGMVIVIIGGHIDLSVGSVVALTGSVSAVLVIRHGQPVVGRRARRPRGRAAGRHVAGLLGRLRRDPGVHRHPRRHAACSAA